MKRFKACSLAVSERSFAFTLVELLATVAVIAVLVGLLIPAVNRGLSSSRTIKCSSNLSQIGKLLSVYAADNNSTTVSTYSSANINWSVIVGGGSAGNQKKPSSELSIWQCPENKFQEFRFESDEQGERACSYTINGFYDEVSHPTIYKDEGRYTASRVANFSHPSSIYAVFEGTYFRSQVGGDGYDMVRWPHGNSMNILFADGHVESLKRPDDGKLPGFGNFVGNSWPEDSDRADAYKNGARWFAK